MRFQIAVSLERQDPMTRSIQFVDWCPTGFKVGINYEAPTVVPGNFCFIRIDDLNFNRLRLLLYFSI